MRTCTSISLAVLAVSLLLCGSAGATTLFYDGFTDDTAGTLPGDAANANLYPINSELGNGWKKIFDMPYDYGTAVQVLNNQNVNVADGIAGANKYAKFTDSALGSHLFPTWDAAQTLNKSLVQVDLDVWMSQSSVAGNGFVFSAFEDTSVNGRSFNMYVSQDTGAVQFFDGNGFVATSLVIPRGSWQHVTVAADMVNATFSMTAGGGMASGYWTSGTHKAGAMMVSSTAPSYVDNVEVFETTSSIPEPSTLALLGAGLLGLLCYAWRRRK
jgi:hypothetical protein